jgi:hypothetical protein
MQYVMCVWNWAGANAASIIALAALGLTIWSALNVRLNARIASLPLLHNFHRTTPPRNVAQAGQPPDIRCQLLAQVINGGLGPAIVTKYEVFANNAPVNLQTKSIADATLAAAFGLASGTFNASWLIAGTAIAIPKDGTVNALDIDFPAPTQAELDRVVSCLHQFRLRIEYQSMHGDQLLFDSDVPSLPPKLNLFWRYKRR